MKTLLHSFVLAVLALLFLPIIISCDKNNQNIDNKESLNHQCPEKVFTDAELGITFKYDPNWTFEVKYTSDENQRHIVGHDAIENGLFKMIIISLSEEKDIDMAVKDWWLIEDEKNKVSENKMNFGPVITNRHQGVTYAANRATIYHPKQKTALDYRIFATRKKGKTIIICEKSEIGGMDGLEGEGFAIVEKTINSIN